MSQVKITGLNVNIVGMSVPNKEFGHAGRAIEQILIDQGIPIDSTAAGADIKHPGYNPLEVKSRDVDATSAQGVCKMLPEYIKVTPYCQSIVFEKMQQQYRVKTKDQLIISGEVYDFSPEYIQDLIEEAYEAARKKLINGNDDPYIYGTAWGYLEQTVKGSKSYEFRISNNAMKKLENTSKSTYKTLFE
jgi:hypothetical protein